MLTTDPTPLMTDPTLLTTEPTALTSDPTLLTTDPTSLRTGPTLLMTHPTPLTVDPTLLMTHPTSLTVDPTLLMTHPTSLTVDPTLLMTHPTLLTVDPTLLTTHPTPLTTGPTQSTTLPQHPQLLQQTLDAAPHSSGLPPLPMPVASAYLESISGRQSFPPPRGPMDAGQLALLIPIVAIGSAAFVKIAKIQAASRGGAQDPETANRLAALEDDVARLRSELSETHERLDFTERLLSQQRPDQIGK